jgi:hypothetical protein
MKHVHDRPDSLSFLLFAAASDESKHMFEILKGRLHSVTYAEINIAEILNDDQFAFFPINSINDALEEDKPKFLLDIDILIELALTH